MEACATCRSDGAVERIPRWKAPLIFVGAILFCPCHLPLTFGILTALAAGLGGAALVGEHRALVYAVFSVIYLALMFLLVRWFLSARDRDRLDEERHAAHAPQA